MLQEDYNYASYCKTRHTREVLCTAFCTGDWTIPRGRIFLFPMLCMLWRMNQDLLLQRESSWYPGVECHQKWEIYWLAFLINTCSNDKLSFIDKFEYQIRLYRIDVIFCTVKIKERQHVSVTFQMFLQINQLTFLLLEELSRSAAPITVLLKTYIFSFSDLSRSFMPLAETLSSLVFIAVSRLRNKVFICTLLWEAKFWRAATKRWNEVMRISVA